MYFYWIRGNQGALSTHFKSKEFTCSCGVCSRQRISQELIGRLQKLREEFGEPITITSGFRCERRQEMLRQEGKETAKGQSTHEIGHAADIWAKDLAKLALLVDKYFDSYGISNRFIHVDIRPPRPDGQKRVWRYGK